MKQRTITTPADLFEDGAYSVNYLTDPQFEFGNEVDALMTLQALSDELRSIRELERHTLRYMAAAAKAARQGAGSDGPVSPQAIITHSGVARQTVYNWINES